MTAVDGGVASTQQIAAAGAAPVTATDVDGSSDAGEHAEASRTRPSGAARWLLWLLAALCVLLLVAVALLAVQVRNQSKTNDAQAAALDAARKTAVTITTVSVPTFDDYRAQVLDRLTGDFKASFTTTLDAYEKEITESKTDTTSKVASAGIVRSDASSATALVALDAVKKNVQAPQGVETQYRMKLELEKVGGDWLVSDLLFVAAEA